MTSLMTRAATVAIAGALTLGLVAPSFAANHARRNAMPAEQGEYLYQGYQSAPVAAHPGAPASVNDQPNACFTDEGYGRFASCDQAGG